MHRCIVHFENGSKEEVDLRHNFSKNSATRIIDLPGNRRFIDRIVFVYDSKKQPNEEIKSFGFWMAVIPMLYNKKGPDIRSFLLLKT